MSLLRWTLMGACVAQPACQGPSAAQRAGSFDTTAVAREGRVVLQCQPADAQVFLDGVPVGLCSDYATDDRGLPVGAGMHTLEFRKSGHYSSRAEVAPDRSQAVVHIQLPPLTEGTPAP